MSMKKKHGIRKITETMNDSQHFVRMKIDEVSRGREIHERTAVFLFGTVFLADVLTGLRVYSSGLFKFPCTQLS